MWMNSEYGAQKSAENILADAEVWLAGSSWSLLVDVKLHHLQKAYFSIYRQPFRSSSVFWNFSQAKHKS